jgi:hypothetical protein
MNITENLMTHNNDKLQPLRKLLLPLVKNGKLDAFDYLNLLAKVDELMTPANQYSQKFDTAEEALQHLFDINEVTFDAVRHIMNDYIEKQFR